MENQVHSHFQLPLLVDNLHGHTSGVKAKGTRYVHALMHTLVSVHTELRSRESG